MKDVEKLSQKIASMIVSIQKLKGSDEQDKEFKNLISFMTTKEMKSIYNAYFENFIYSSKEKPTEEELELLRLILESSITIYNYSGEDTGLTDSEYDSLLEYYKNITGRDEIFVDQVITSGDIVSHKYKSLRGTLDKIYKLTDEDVLKNPSQKSLEDWVNKSQRKILSVTGEEIDLWDCDVLVMPKFDGVSCVFECDRYGKLLKALTRGDTTRNEAQDVTHIFKEIYEGPFKDSFSEYGEKTEIMMLDSDLETYNETYNKDYKNTRSIVSSIMNSKEVDERVNYLKIVSLRYSMFVNGEETRQEISPRMYNFPHITCKLREVEKIHDFAFKHRYVEPGYRCDGAVICIIDEYIQDILGRENEKQKYEVAFKYTEEKAYSKVTGIEFSPGLFGRLTPVVTFKPKKMKGNTVSRASIGSLKRFKELQLAIGDEIKILYDIIPYIVFDDKDENCSRSSNDPIEIPHVCPDCGKKLVANEKGNILYCKNPECTWRIKGKILNFIKKMNISDISFETVDTLYKLGYLDKIEDLFSLKEYKKEISDLDNFGEKKVDNFLKEIDNIEPMSEATMLGAIGIESVSKKKFQSVLDYLSYDELISYALEGNKEVFLVIPKIKEKTTEKIIEGIQSNIDLIRFLEKKLTLYKEESKSSLFSVCFTKIRDKDKEKFIKEMGGQVVDNVTKDTSFVVVEREGISSGKTKDAEKYGIPIITIDKMEDYIRENF